MRGLLTEAVALTLLVIDETGGATLSEIARLTGKPVSTLQRAVDGLAQRGVLRRESPRGRLLLRIDAPRRALREVSEWSLGTERVSDLRQASRTLGQSASKEAPRTIRNDRIRSAWPRAIGSIVETYDPAQVILFGSQARGDATPDSDVDLLVVFDRVGDRRERRVGIRRLLRNMPFAKDILVASTNDIAHPAAGTAIAEAVHGGLIVYER